VMPKGFAKTTDPDFQDWLAETIRNAAGRRVEFRYT
jgi:hypothetical protein